MVIVGEPCNVDARANILALFMIMLYPWLCVRMYCTHWLWLYSCLSSLTDRSIASIQGTPHTHTHTIHTHRFKCWAQVPRLKIRWRGPSRQARGIPSLLQAPLCLCMAPKPDVCGMIIVLITNRITNYSAIVESFLHTLNKSFVPPILSYERSFTWNLKVTISILLLTLLTHVNIVTNS